MRQITLLIILVSMMETEVKKEEDVFVSERISKSASIHLQDAIDEVFPLFGPIMEKEWARGWNPEIIYFTTGLVEEHMIFKTEGRYEDEGTYLWMVSKYLPKQYLIEYTVSTLQRVWTILVECKPAGDDKTMVNVTYTFTGLTSRGNELNAKALEMMYADGLMDWEEQINYYLNTGRIKN